MNMTNNLDVSDEENSEKNKLSEIKDTSDITPKKFSIISYFIVLVVLGIPIWWYTTRVYRASLPLDEIYNLQLKEQNLSSYGLPLSLDYDILISFVNPEPENIQIKLNPLEIDAYLQNFLKTISPVADFKVKSQWLYLTELGAIPRKILDHYALLENQLPHIITPLESKLWSHVSLRPSINLVVYFPHCRAPLYIYNSNNEMSTTNAFISPRWGGLYIMNPDKKSCDLRKFHPNTKQITQIFQEILKELFKLQGVSIDEFKMRKTSEMVESSKRTLKSLAQLLSEIRSIVISDIVAEKISFALESVQQSEIARDLGDHEQALYHAKLAFRNAEDAFAHPSLLALLYFPDDQKYAIYIPLFLPVMIPVLMSLMQIKKKKEKGKKTKTE